MMILVFAVGFVAGMAGMLFCLATSIAVTLVTDERKEKDDDDE